MVEVVEAVGKGEVGKMVSLLCIMPSRYPNLGAFCDLACLPRLAHGHSTFIVLKTNFRLRLYVSKAR